MTEKKDAVEAFYHEIAEVLGTHYDCEGFPWYRRTRWNNRRPGGGRFPGYGIVRLFGDTVHIALTAPQQITRIIQGKDEAIAFLRSLNPT